MVLEKEIGLVYVPKQRETIWLKLKQLDPKGASAEHTKNLKKGFM